jgi:hypothetical protein
VKEAGMDLTWRAQKKVTLKRGAFFPRYTIWKLFFKTLTVFLDNIDIIFEV